MEGEKSVLVEGKKKEEAARQDEVEHTMQPYIRKRRPRNPSMRNLHRPKIDAREPRKRRVSCSEKDDERRRAKSEDTSTVGKVASVLAKGCRVIGVAGGGKDGQRNRMKEGEEKRRTMLRERRGGSHQRRDMRSLAGTLLRTRSKDAEGSAPSSTSQVDSSSRTAKRRRGSRSRRTARG
jgi:hypothetical protein